MIHKRVSGFILEAVITLIIQNMEIYKDELFFKEGIINGQMRIYIRQLIVHIIYFGK